MSSLWDQITGHDEVVRHLKEEAASPSHAYLFAGPQGVGKATVAGIFAAAMNCASNACGSCPSCIKVSHRAHPDVHFLEPAGKSEYLIGQIVRRPSSGDFVVVEEANRTPFEGRMKVFIFEEADRLGEEAANALLKTLEEPPGDAVFILIAESTASILPTVLSRCRPVRFSNISRDKVVELLVDRGVDAGVAELAVHLTGGVLGEAYAYAKSPAKRARRETVLSAVGRLPGSSAAEVSFMAEELLVAARAGLSELKASQEAEITKAIELAPTPQLEQQLRRRLEERHKRTALKEEERGFEEVLEMLAIWYRDALLKAVGGDESLVVNIDRLSELERESKRPPRRLVNCVEALAGVRKVASFNVTMLMALEAALFKLQKELA